MHPSTKFIVIAVSAIIVIVGIVFFTRFFSTPKEQLKIGIRTYSSPLTASVKAENIFDGFDIELARKIAKKLNRKLNIKHYQEDHIIQALNTGEIDLICDSMAITQKRMDAMEAIHVYGIPHSYITGVIWKNIPKNLVNIHDLKQLLHKKKKAACVLKNSVWYDILQEYGISHIITVNTEDELIRPLKNGQALIVFAGQFRADFFNKQNSDIKIFKMQLDKPWGFGAGVFAKKGNKKLADAVSNVIDTLKNDGTITQLQCKWFGRTFDKK